MARPLPHRYPFDGYNYAFLIKDDPAYNERHIANVKRKDRSAAVVEERYFLIKLSDAAEIARQVFDEY